MTQRPNTCLELLQFIPLFSIWGQLQEIIIICTISEEMFLKGLQGVKDEASCCISKSLLAWSSGTASLPIPIFTNIYCFSAEAAYPPSKS